MYRKRNTDENKRGQNKKNQSQNRANLSLFLKNPGLKKKGGSSTI